MKLIDIAYQLGQAMGLTGDESIHSFTRMMQSCSLMRLDTFGMSSRRVKNRMAAMALTHPRMSCKRLFVEAIREEGKLIVQRLAVKDGR